MKREIHRAPYAAAWKKELGDVDWDKTSDMLKGFSRYVDRTAVGIPLGGFGAGNFEYNLTGSFGPWQMEPGHLERRFLETAAFHVREQTVKKEEGHHSAMALQKEKEKPERIAKTLAAECKFGQSQNRLASAWSEHLLEIGSADYYALYPVGWTDYKNNFRTRLSMEFFSPIIADNYRETSLPLAYFVFHGENPTEESIELSLMFTFPNMPLYMEQKEESFVTAIIGAEGMDGGAVPEVRRKGLKNRLERREDITGLVMSSVSDQNEWKVQGSEFCIAAEQSEGVELSWCTSWDADLEAGALWEMFEEKGTLTDLNTECESPAGALCMRFTLAPGESRDVPFALSWNFPVFQCGSEKTGEFQRWWKKYTAYYPPARGERAEWQSKEFVPQAFHIAEDGLKDLEKNYKAVHGWMESYLTNPAYRGKEWVLTAGFNELYYNAFGGSFWENGLIQSQYRDFDGNPISTEEKRFGGRDYRTDTRYADYVDRYQQKEQSLHYTIEAQEFPFAETFDVRGHSHRVYTDLWPEIERDILLAYKDFIMDEPEGACPHDAGNINGGAFFTYDYYFAMVSIMNRDAYEHVVGKRYTTPWSEFSPKFILYAYEYWEKTGDEAFLHDAWDGIVRSYIYERRTDTDNDGITNMKSSEYDHNELFNSVLCAGALEAVISLCQSHPEFAAERVCYKVENEKGEVLADVDTMLMEDAEKELKRIRAYLETKLWDESGEYYQFGAGMPILMADAFIGECHVQNAGLEMTVDADRLAKHFRKLYRHNVQEIGHCGAKNLVNLEPENDYETGDGVIDHYADVWTGVSYVLGANMYRLGLKLGDDSLQAAGLDTAHGVYVTTYENRDTAYYFNTPEAWNAGNPRISRNRMYQRARGAWELLRAVGGPQAEDVAGR